MTPGKVRDIVALFVVVGLVLLAGIWATGGLSGRPKMVLATTTSTEDSGLLDYLLPVFERAHDVDVKVIAVGTGQALELARRGDADVTLVHAKARELEFMAQGHGAYRLPVMYNYFVIVGPPEDPAGIRGTNVTIALQRIAASEATFLSRGDRSGTHTKELQLWALAGITPAGRWYKEVGNGMEATLRMADQLRAYTLSDDGTFTVHQDRLGLAKVVPPEPPLENHYSVIPVNVTRHPNVRSAYADAFAMWITGPEGQALIASYKVRGTQIFYPEG